MNRLRHDRRIADIAVVHAGLTIYRVAGADPGIVWCFTTCARCAMQKDGTAVPHVFDVRGLPNPERLDLETGDEALRRSSISAILRHGTEAGAIAPVRCDDRLYTLEFAVPFDTPGGYVRALFALYGLPRSAADAFFADVSAAISSGRHDLLVSEDDAIGTALDAAFASSGCDDAVRGALFAELTSMVVRDARAA